MSEKKVNEKSTKSEILDVYNSILEDLKSKNEKIFKMEKENSVGLTKIKDQLNPEKLNKFFLDLKNKLEICESLSDEIEESKKKIEEIYGIKVEAQSFASLVRAKKEYAEDKDKLISEKFKLKEKELNEHILAIRDLADKEKKDFDREKEDWKYEFNRIKKKDSDEFKDKLASELKDLNEKKAEFEKEKTEFVSFKEELDSIEEKLDQREEEINGKLEEEKAKIETKVKKSGEFQLTIVKKTYESKVEILEAKSANDEKTISKLEDELAETKAKLDSSYTRIQEISVAKVGPSTEELLSRISNQKEK